MGRTGRDRGIVVGVRMVRTEGGVWRGDRVGTSIVMKRGKTRNFLDKTKRKSVEEYRV